MRTLAVTLVWALTATLFGVARADNAAPQPFVATYAISYRGLNAGKLVLRFAREPAAAQYSFETQAYPSTLARLFVSAAALERSIVQIDAQGVRPLRWQLEDGKAGAEADGTLRFDWSANTVSGHIEGQRIHLHAVPGLQDRSSIQIAVATALLRGQEPGVIPLIDDNRIKHYTYARAGAAVLDSPLGRLDAVIYESTRAGSQRVSRFWLVPTLEYLPARAEQIRKGRVETVMTLIELHRPGPAASASAEP